MYTNIINKEIIKLKNNIVIMNYIYVSVCVYCYCYFYLVESFHPIQELR